MGDEIEALSFAEVVERFARFDIIPEGGGDTRTFRRYRMGLGLAREFHTVAFHGDEGLVYPPTILTALRYFGIDVYDWNCGEE